MSLNRSGPTIVKGYPGRTIGKVLRVVQDNSRDITRNLECSSKTLDFQRHEQMGKLGGGRKYAIVREL